MNPYREFISEIIRTMREAETYPLGGLQPIVNIDLEIQAPKVLIFSPHPDDESIIGALPLRLLRELKMRVINVAVTQGSNKARQQDRFLELTNACNYLGFDLLQTREGGLERITLESRSQDTRAWNQSVDRIKEILTLNRPQIMFFPHAGDGNSTHIGTHWLIIDALSQMDSNFSCYAIETEYWKQMAQPNLLVESSPQDVIDLVTALSFHQGEVIRNPYHLRLPAWMIDNVRRGSEIVGQQGDEAPKFIFATIYKLSLWSDGKLENALQMGRYVPISCDLSELFSS